MLIYHDVCVQIFKSAPDGADITNSRVLGGATSSPYTPSRVLSHSAGGDPVTPISFTPDRNSFMTEGVDTSTPSRARWRSSGGYYVQSPLRKFCSPYIHSFLIVYTIILKSICLSVAVRKLHVSIIARSSREISQTVRIDYHSLLYRVHISVRRSKFFVGENHPKTISKTESLLSL